MTVQAPPRPRCTTIKVDGEQCGSEILYQGGPACFQHSKTADSPRRSRGWEGMTLAELEAKDRRVNTDPRFYDWGYHLDPWFNVPTAAGKLGQTPQHLYKCRWEIRYQAKLADVAADWIPPRPEGIPASHFDLLEDHIPVLIAGFLDFRGTYFKTERREPFVTPEFQQVWAASIIRTLVTGGKQAVLAPVRHGKTMVLAHLATYLICLYPNIRILWVSVAERIAAKPVGLVARILAGNKELIDVYAGPGQSFKPGAKGGQSWSKGEFTVATRTAFDINGPSMMAIGRGGTLVSLNADVIVIDDLEDKGSVAQAGTREGTREWYTTQLESRKEEHTGLFVIGSRQAPDDIYAHLLENDEYQVIVEQAHDDACDLDEYDYDVHVDCMLFPEVRSYRWLIKQKLSSETTGGEAMWRMTYQNQVTGSGLAVFDKEAVLACRSKGYRIGQYPTVQAHGVDAHGSGIRLVAGLDPSHVGFQASVLFAYQTAPELKIWLLDLENKEGGGVPAAERIIRRWNEQYSVSHWVIETNLLGSMGQYKEIREYANAHGIHLQDWRTYSNKSDPYYGVTSLAPLFTKGTFVLPYGDPESEEKTNQFCKQFWLWDGSSSRNRNPRHGQKDDVVMASWFAWDVIRRARQEFNTEAGVDMSGMPFAPDNWDSAPWGESWNLPPW